MKSLLLAIFAGLLGGIVRSVLGWAKTEEPFDPLKFIKSLIRAAIGGAVFGFGIGLDPISTFFAAITTDVLWHDAWKAIQK